MPHSHLPELGSGGQRLTTKKMDGTVTDITQMKLIGVCVFFLNLIPQNWSFRSQLIAFDKN